MVDKATSLLTDLITPLWALRAIVRSADTIVHASNEADLLVDICETIASDPRYPLAIVGWARTDSERSIEIVAAGGSARAYADRLMLSWGENVYGRGPSGTAIRTGEVQVNSSAANNPAFGIWHEHAREYGLVASVALPLRIGGRIEGFLGIYSSKSESFHEAELQVLRVLADTLGFGIHTRREQIRYSAVFKTTISALAEALAKRDAYTAGHQKRVTHLAVEIAREMGLSDERRLGLHFAGLVHDIGKIQIPAELLTKPTRLTPAEFELMKAHPEAGYEILKDIDFPWPVAEIVRQHHETLDGGGYPHGLKGEDILPEARILAVADIVEAMSSHRPYRPALGVDLALAEIQRLRGNSLDHTAVEACVTLFSTKNYVLPPY